MSYPASDGGSGWSKDQTPLQTTASILDRLTFWVAAHLAEEAGRLPLWLPVGLALGIAAYFQLREEPPALTGVLAIGISVLLMLARFPWLRFAGIWLCVLSAGFSAAQFRTAMVASPILSFETGPTMVEGRVVTVDRLEEGARVLLEEVVADRLSAQHRPARVRVRLHRHEEWMPAPGDRVRMLAILRPPLEPAAPDAFDFRRHAFFQQIGAVGFALSRLERLSAVPPQGWNRVTISIERLRQRIAERVAERLNGPEGAVTTALLNGQPTAIPEQDIEALRKSGLQHLLSISGLHIGLVAGLVFFSVRALLALSPPLALRYPIKKWAAVAALLAASGYMLLVGAPVPTQRSVLMTGIMLLAVMVDRSPFSMRVVAVAATVILLIQPESLVGPSFQMSFAAVIALIAAYEVLRGRLSSGGDIGPVRKGLLYVAGLSVTSLVAGAATTPFALYHFQQMANYGILANLLAVPITSFWVMPFGVLALMLMPLGLEGPALDVMGLGVSGILWSAHWVADLPGAAIQIPAMPVHGLALVSLGGAWLVIWTRRWRLAGLAAILLGVATCWTTARPDLLVANSGKLVGVRAPDGELWVSSGRAARFEAELWRERDGLTGAPPAWSKSGTRDGWTGCDPSGCVSRVAGRIVAVAYAVDALAEDCAMADIVITSVPDAQCPAPLVIGPETLRQYGSHALFIGPEGIRVETGRAARRARPWN
nr:ComEC/Rec2 family competence protein [Indioceanicola profundi]